jgi:hypothetical protein
MSESSPEATVESTEQAQVAEPKTFTEDYVKELRAEAAKYRTEAKQFKSEIEKVRKASLTEAEQAVLEAEQRGRMSVLADFGQKLARSAFVAEAAKRNPGYDADAVLDDINLARYIGEDGEPDAKAIAAAVTRLVPEAVAGPRGVGDADLGGRSGGTPLPLNGDPLTNSLKSKLGIT